MMVVDPLNARDRRRLFTSSGFLLSTLAATAVTQSYYISAAVLSGTLDGPLWARLVAAFVPAWSIGVLLALAPGRWMQTIWRGLLVCVIAATIGALLRVFLQDSLQVYANMNLGTTVLEFGLGFGISLVISTIVVNRIWISRGERASQRQASASRVREEIAISALRSEEVRLHHAVAEGLHGSLQQRLVLLNAEIDGVREQLAAAAVSTDLLTQLDNLTDTVDVLREETVRATSRLLTPEGLEIGLIPALRLLLGRLPSTIGYSLNASPQVRLLDDPAATAIGPELRLLVVRVVEEAVTNALRHGRATQLAVDLVLDDAPGDSSAHPRLCVEVHNDGSGFDPADAEESGLSRLSDRVALIDGVLSITSSPGAGAGVTVRAKIPLVPEVPVVPSALFRGAAKIELPAPSAVPALGA